MLYILSIRCEYRNAPEM